MTQLAAGTVVLADWMINRRKSSDVGDHFIDDVLRQINKTVEQVIIAPFSTNTIIKIDTRKIDIWSMSAEYRKIHANSGVIAFGRELPEQKIWWASNFSDKDELSVYAQTIARCQVDLEWKKKEKEDADAILRMMKGDFSNLKK